MVSRGVGAFVVLLVRFDREIVHGTLIIIAHKVQGPKIPQHESLTKARPPITLTPRTWGCIASRIEGGRRQ
jgi:hypothetical protein